ncbi:Protein F40H3.3, partial [Aphelenchoides avenae]
FRIPLPFGGIDVKKGPDGESQVGIGSNVNILGWGGNSGLTFTKKNGSFTTQTQGGILTNGTQRGLNSTFGVDKNEGLTADTDLQLGKNKTVHGGVGKESQFINELSGVIKDGEEERKAKAASRP